MLETIKLGMYKVCLCLVSMMVIFFPLFFLFFPSFSFLFLCTKCLPSLKMMQIMFRCLLGGAYQAVWLWSGIFQLLAVVELQ